MLALAFTELGASAAISSAWSDNHASLAVSRHLGYTEVHRAPHRHHDRHGELVHLRLARPEWVTVESAQREPSEVAAPPQALTAFGDPRSMVTFCGTAELEACQ